MKPVAKECFCFKLQAKGLDYVDLNLRLKCRKGLLIASPCAPLHDQTWPF